MTWRGEVEDGIGWGALVPSKAERAASRIKALERQLEANNPLLDEAAAYIEKLEAAQSEAYAEGRSDERRAIDSELIAVLGGPWYMDPPDGGDVPPLEQVRRMAQDAARWRWFVAGLHDQGPKLAASVDAAIQQDRQTP